MVTNKLTSLDEKYMMVPTVLTDYAQSMFNERSWQKRDHYRMRFEKIREYVDTVLRLETEDRNHKKKNNGK